MLYDTSSLCKPSDLPTIIVAAVKESEAIYNACLDRGIRVHGFCDSIRDKCDHLFCGLPVYHTPALRTHFNAARFIIASQHIQDCIEQLSELGYSEFFSPLDLLLHYNVDAHSHSSATNDYMRSRLQVCINSHTIYKAGRSSSYMRSLDVMITTKCTLRCESCCNLMPYYSKHSPFSSDSILASIRRLSNSVDLISEFRIIGGEPLLNKDWSVICRQLAYDHPSQMIYIYTNGTISPSETELMSISGTNVNFIITSYGALSRNLTELESRLDKYQISYVTTPAQYWVDCSTITYHDRTSTQLREVFKECCVKYLYTLLHGRLYRCPFIANAANLNAIPDDPGNYVDLSSDFPDLKSKLINFISNKPFFPGCNYCVGRPYDATSSRGYNGKGMVVAGKQTKGLLTYTTYNIT